MRILFVFLTLLLATDASQAQVASAVNAARIKKAPAPEMGLGVAGLVMVAGTAYLVRRRRLG